MLPSDGHDAIAETGAALAPCATHATRVLPIAAADWRAAGGAARCRNAIDMARPTAKIAA